MVGAARDIDIGPEDSVYVISNTLTSTGYTLHKLDPTDQWITIPGTPANVKSIAVDPNGQVWIGNMNG